MQHQPINKQVSIIDPNYTHLCDTTVRSFYKIMKINLLGVKQQYRVDFFLLWFYHNNIQKTQYSNLKNRHDLTLPASLQSQKRS